MPQRLQDLHGTSELRRWEGHADVRRGRGVLARIIAGLMGFSKPETQVPVAVTFSPEAGGERWTRTFGSKVFSSLQSNGAGKDSFLLVERFGAVSVALALVVEGERLILIPRRWSLFGMPLPQSLIPSGQSFETEIDGQFCFDVEISAPFVGMIAAYRGILRPAGVEIAGEKRPS